MPDITSPLYVAMSTINKSTRATSYLTWRDTVETGYHAHIPDERSPTKHANRSIFLLDTSAVVLDRFYSFVRRRVRLVAEREVFD